MWAAIKWALALWRAWRSSPILSEVIAVGAEFMTQIPPGLVAKGIVLIREAAENDALATGTEKQEYVMRVLRQEYPDLGTSLINAAIPIIFKAIQRGLL